MRTAVLLAVGFGAALAFLEVAEEVLEGAATPFDHSVSLWLHEIDSPALDEVMRAFTFLGSVPAIVGAVALVAAWALLRGARVPGGVLVAVASAAEALNALLKAVFRRPRPALFVETLAPDSHSFPSGHAMASTAVYGMAAFVIARIEPRLRRPLYVATPALVLFIGCSRVYLGVHWATDVLAGFAAGGLVLVAGTLALGRAHRASAHGDS